jgi:hypothetical protein
MNLEYVHFQKPVRLPTHQSELGALSIWRGSERDIQHPDNDRPSWHIVLKDRWIEISITDVVKEKLGGNAEKDYVMCVPIENVAWFRALPVQPKKAKAADVSIRAVSNA